MLRLPLFSQPLLSASRVQDLIGGTTKQTRQIYPDTHTWRPILTFLPQRIMNKCTHGPNQAMKLSKEPTTRKPLDNFTMTLWLKSSYDIPGLWHENARVTSGEHLRGKSYKRTSIPP